MYGLSPVATSSKVLEYQEKLGFFQPSTDLRLAAGMTTNMIANMSKEGKHISMDTLARICETLNCEITDVIELVPDEPASTGGKEHERIKTKNNGKRN